MIKSTTESENKNTKGFLLIHSHFFHLLDAFMVSIRSTAELVALQGNWSSSFLLPACPQRREKGEYWFLHGFCCSLFRLHYVIWVIPSPPTVFTTCENTIKQYEPSKLLKCSKFPHLTPKGAIWPVGEKAEEDEGRMMMGRSRSKMERSTCSLPFN